MERTIEKMKEYLMQRCVKTDNGCMEWKLSVTNKGYGRLRDGNKMKRAHRESYKVFVGNIPNGMFVCHKCDNPKCINPDHLFLGTSYDNMRDMVAKGRNRVIPSYGNNYSSKPISANGKKYISCKAASRELGITDMGIRKRIKLNWPGYAFLY